MQCHQIAARLQMMQWRMEWMWNDVVCDTISKVINCETWTSVKVCQSRCTCKCYSGGWSECETMLCVTQFTKWSIPKNEHLWKCANHINYTFKCCNVSDNVKSKVLNFKQFSSDNTVSPNCSALVIVKPKVLNFKQNISEDSVPKLQRACKWCNGWWVNVKRCCVWHNFQSDQWRNMNICESVPITLHVQMLQWRPKWVWNHVVCDTISKVINSEKWTSVKVCQSH